MAKFYSLFSSSSGNAAYLGNGSAGILFDIGVSCRKLCTALQERELAPNAIQAICITHTHIDHIRGLAVFLKNYPIPVYGTAETLQTLAEQCNRTDLFHTVICGMNSITTAASGIVWRGECGHLPLSSNGFRLPRCDRVKQVCTDLGTVTPEVRNGVQGCDMVLLEANYEPSLLAAGAYPYPLKQRISGEQGHLSNQDSADFARELVETGTTRLVLGHLSPHNNTAACAERAALQGMPDMVRNLDYLLQVATPIGLKQAVIF